MGYSVIRAWSLWETCAVLAWMLYFQCIGRSYSITSTSTSTSTNAELSLYNTQSPSPRMCITSPHIPRHSSLPLPNSSATPSPNRRTTRIRIRNDNTWIRLSPITGLLDARAGVAEGGWARLRLHGG